MIGFSGMVMQNIMSMLPRIASFILMVVSSGVSLSLGMLCVSVALVGCSCNSYRMCHALLLNDFLEFWNRIIIEMKYGDVAIAKCGLCYSPQG